MTTPKKTAKTKAPKTANTDTAIGFLLDETGSMESIRDATISGFNEFVASQKKLGGHAPMSLTTFDSESWNPRFVGEDIANVPDLTRETYRPGAMTPLYDAIYRMVMALQENVAVNGWKGKVLLVIQTDGLENASREHPGEQGHRDVRALLERKQREDGWTVVFLGAGIDAAVVGTGIGVPVGNTMSYAATPAGTKGAFAGTAHSTLNYRRSGVAGQSVSNFYDDDDADKQAKTP